MRMTAATLAVGTEVTDGQILDRNSQWLSQRLARAGLKVVEHRAVPDDRTAISVALRELSSRVNFLFVTGGLGPTSDDFTREVLAEVFNRPLEYHSASWEKIEKRFAERGVVARPIQKSQCYYPSLSRILDNPAGTANAFSFEVPRTPLVSQETNLVPLSALEVRPLVVYALPGPPVEIGAIWEKHLASEIESLIPAELRYQLLLLRTLGCGESDIAEKVEAIVGQGSMLNLLQGGLQVGYRVHVPYVEVKLWFSRQDAQIVRPILEKVEEVLAPWLVSRGENDIEDDIADQLVSRIDAGLRLSIIDGATGGILQSRLQQSLDRSPQRLGRSPQGLAEQGIFDRSGGARGALDFRTLWPPGDVMDRGHDQMIQGSWHLSAVTLFDEQAGVWRLRVKSAAGEDLDLEVTPSPLYKNGTERARRYVAERVLLAIDGMAQKLAFFS